MCELLRIPKPLFPHLENGHNTKIDVLGFLGGLILMGQYLQSLMEEALPHVMQTEGPPKD